MAKHQFPQSGQVSTVPPAMLELGHREQAGGRILVRANCDNRIRWRPGDRLQHLFEQRCTASASSPASRAAIDTSLGRVSLAELDKRANRLARYLIRNGVRPGDRIAILLHRSLETYVAMLAVLKAGAAYVPLDPAFPEERVAFIIDDSSAGCLIAGESLCRLAPDGVSLVVPEREREAIAAEAGERPEIADRAADALCYVIYTSGSTGKPKGVPIRHSSICNFVQVAAETYGIRPRDRMYQGLSIAFDFCVEEIWVPLAAGATIVPGPAEGNLVGRDLSDFLRRQRVSALCCVPTLLATLEDDLPDLRFLLVSGEACPQDLVKRWYRPNRVLLNAYGPTEATVTATLGELHPDRPVTIGSPLPTYTALVLAVDEQRILQHGETGELCLAGVGLAEGYLNRADLTQKVFIDDFIGIANNPTGRIYRTGDLVRVNEAGEIEHLGRTDTQVKVRGYRIELSEIESVLMQVPQVSQAVVTTHETLPGLVELVAYYSVRESADPPSQDRLFSELRAHLPSYMLPSYLEEVAAIPLLTSHKADRAKLPAPSGRRYVAADTLRYEPPRTAVESTIATAFAEVLQLEQVSVTDHFLDDLGANSLLMAHALTRIRHRLGVPIAMKDIYLHPRVRDLAQHLEQYEAGGQPLLRQETREWVGDRQYYLCGAAQAAVYFLYISCVTALLYEVVAWVTLTSGLANLYARSVVAAAATFAVLTLVPIALKWLLVGRWTAERFPVWSWRYLRFWLVKQLVRTNPLVLFVGSPIYAFYLRALGAAIGRDVVILSPLVPVCTDLLQIGDGAVIRKDVYFSGYAARSGAIETGPITIGAGAFVGENCVIDIHTEIGEGAELGHVSALHRGAAIPAGRSFHGSPAVATTTRFAMTSRMRPSNLRKVGYSMMQLMMLLLVGGPGVIVLAISAARRLPQDSHVLIGESFSNVDPATFLGDQLVWSLALFLGSLVGGLLFIVSVPRLYNLLLEPGREYPLYGLRYFAFRTVAAFTNSRLYNTIFGDSSFIIGYLRALGYRITAYQQTGSNFGLRQKHDIPYLCSIGNRTLVCDGLSMVNAAVSNASFRLGRVSIGADNFLGNLIAFPAEAKTGENCLLASKVMLPIDGRVRENVGLLGSPCFEIPRSVLRDRQFDHYKAPKVLRERLRRKNLHNLATIGLYLLSRWFLVFVIMTLAAAAYAYHGLLGPLGFATAILALTIVTPAYFVLLERAALRFGRMTPQYCSIYDPYYWWHERYWKINETNFIAAFNGTPFKNLVWRLMGVRWGRRNFDDGCSMTERTLVEVGDGNTFGEHCSLQSHSLEDGIFKSDYIRIGSDCTIGANAYVHYATTLADGTILEPDSFLMKGETTQADEIWVGNPARQSRR